ncbi:MAG: hypothetical protein K8F60_17965 [Melioribacteraceae bacterium]|jgi:hypothetical protein|nr:hypothetical protein [Ignavibacteriota bacterium]MBZ0184351.1 hypothetical protein [Melioribacteraceae bacterium]|tara:strand:- start:53 stop:259 length:207 start_codon:yes stop_codon:yes gene_type:complete
MSENICQYEHKKGLPHIDFKCHYSGWGLFWFYVGISAKPIKVDFICSKCGKVFETATDEATLKKYVGR